MNTPSSSILPPSHPQNQETPLQNSSVPATDDLDFDTPANRLTALRMILVPVVVAGLLKDDPWWNLFACIFFIIAAITDYFDGYLARTSKRVTVLGQLADPLADKFLVASSLIMLQDLGRISPLVVIVLLCREFAITGLRAIASAEGIVIAASQMAKWKTVAQMVGLPVLMLAPLARPFYFLEIGQGFLYLSLLISVVSLKDYVFDFFKQLLEIRRRKKAQRSAARQGQRLFRKLRLRKTEASSKV